MPSDIGVRHTTAPHRLGVRRTKTITAQRARDAEHRSGEVFAIAFLQREHDVGAKCRLVGRIDVKAFRDESVLRVKALWPEPGVKFGAGRVQRLMAELDRLAALEAAQARV